MAAAYGPAIANGSNADEKHNEQKTRGSPVIFAGDRANID